MNNVNKKKDAQGRARDYVTNKLLSVFTIAFVMIIGLMGISKMMRRTDTFVAAFRGIGVFAWVLLGITVVLAALAIVRKVLGKDDQYRLLSAKNAAVVFGFAALCFGALALAFNDSTLRILYVFIPAVTVLYIIFHTYPRDFFALATVAGFGAIGIWLMGTALGGGSGASKVWLIIGIMLAAIAIVTVVTVLIQANGGSLFRNGKYHVFTQDAHYTLLYITYAALLVLTVLTWFFAGAMMYYFVFALLAYLVFAGVYYTIKMI